MEITADMPGENENKVNDERAPLALRPFAATGRTVIAWVGSLGAAAIFLFLAVARIPGRNQFSRIVQQTYYIGASSITIIMLVSLFTGMVLGLQSYHALVQFGAAGAVGSLVSLSLIMELGPVLTAIMITARAGSAITAEIEQLTARARQGLNQEERQRLAELLVKKHPSSAPTGGGPV